MQLYHYRNDQFGLLSLHEKRLKIARINELNDPFELLGCELSNQERRRAFNLMKNNLNNDKGLLCFSANWHNPVQWAHYTDNHEGICMGFEVPKKDLIKVKYVTNRLNCPDKISLKYMEKILSTKFSHWRYEKEYRFFLGLDHSLQEGGLYFENFGENLKLNKVIVGCNSKLSRKKIQEALGNEADSVEVFKTRPAFKTFQIVQNKNNILWT